MIDAAEELERGAANALLKNLEEPPAGTLFLLVSHAPGRLLPTIRSRCRMLRFSPLRDDEMETVLRAELPDADIHAIAALLAAGEGSPVRALVLSGFYLSCLVACFFALALFVSVNTVPRLSLFLVLSSQPSPFLY